MMSNNTRPDPAIKMGLLDIRFASACGAITQQQAKTIRGQFMRGQIKDLEKTISKAADSTRKRRVANKAGRA